MNTIRRVIAVFGLVAVAVIAVQLMREDVGLTDAAWRAAAVFGIAIVATLAAPGVVKVFASSLGSND